jgi:hypothetical protein
MRDCSNLSNLIYLGKTSKSRAKISLLRVQVLVILRFFNELIDLAYAVPPTLRQSNTRYCNIGRKFSMRNGGMQRHAEAFKRLDDFTWEEIELHPCSITLRGIDMLSF